MTSPPTSTVPLPRRPAEGVRPEDRKAGSRFSGYAAVVIQRARWLREVEGVHERAPVVGLLGSRLASRAALAAAVLSALVSGCGRAREEPASSAPRHAREREAQGSEGGPGRADDASSSPSDSAEGTEGSPDAMHPDASARLAASGSRQGAYEWMAWASAPGGAHDAEQWRLQACVGPGRLRGPCDSRDPHPHPPGPAGLDRILDDLSACHVRRASTRRTRRYRREHIEFVVAPDGRVSAARSSSSGPPEPGVEGCTTEAARAVGSLHLPPGSFTYVLAFGGAHLTMGVPTDP